MHVEPLRHLEQHAAPMLFAAIRRQGGPGGVALRRFQRRGIAGFVGEPCRDLPGIAPLPFGDSYVGIGRNAGQPVEFASETRSVECRGLGFLDPPDRAALHEQAFDRIERRQRVMARLQRLHLVRDPEQIAEEILDVRRQFDEQIRLSLMLEPVRIAPRRHQPIVQSNIAVGEMANKRPIDAYETVAIIEIGETEAVRENKIGHQGKDPAEKARRRAAACS